MLKMCVKIGGEKRGEKEGIKMGVNCGCKNNSLFLVIFKAEGLRKCLAKRKVEINENSSCKKASGLICCF
jgi:hypothetical protein